MQDIGKIKGPQKLTKQINYIIHQNTRAIYPKKGYYLDTDLPLCPGLDIWGGLRSGRKGQPRRLAKLAKHFHVCWKCRNAFVYRDKEHANEDYEKIHLKKLRKSLTRALARSL